MATRDTTKTRGRIMQAAFDLFYNQGYQATTIDQVIDKSGVSRPTVYTHFSTKEELCQAYLKERSERHLSGFREALEKEPTARGRYLTFLREVGKEMVSSNYRGCGFFNMISEVADPAHPLFHEARKFVDGLRAMIRDTVEGLKQSEARYQALDVDHVAETYYLLLGGLIMASQEYRQKWPLERTLRAAEALIGD